MRALLDLLVAQQTTRSLTGWEVWEGGRQEDRNTWTREITRIRTHFHFGTHNLQNLQDMMHSLNVEISAGVPFGWRTSQSLCAIWTVPIPRTFHLASSTSCCLARAQRSNMIQYDPMFGDVLEDSQGCSTYCSTFEKKDCSFACKLVELFVLIPLPRPEGYMKDGEARPRRGKFQNFRRFLDLRLRSIRALRSLIQIQPRQTTGCVLLDMLGRWHFIVPSVPTVRWSMNLQVPRWFWHYFVIFGFSSGLFFIH